MRGESDLGKLSKQYSSKDMPSHTKLKYRQIGQNAPEEIRSRDLHRELHDRERSARSDKRSSDSSRYGFNYTLLKSFSFEMLLSFI